MFESVGVLAGLRLRRDKPQDSKAQYRYVEWAGSNRRRTSRSVQCCSWMLFPGPYRTVLAD